MSLIAICVLPAAALAATDRVTRTVALPEHRRLALEITVGDVRVEGSSRGDALIEVVRRAPSEDALKRVPIDLEEGEDIVRLRALQLNGNTEATIRTDVTLYVPSTAKLDPLRVMEGQVTLTNLHGALTVETKRGSVAATDVSGAIRIETGIGNITVDRAILSAAGVLRLRTFNGDVKLALAERPSDARVMALALNGTVRSDIPLTLKEQWGPRWGQATLGKGEPMISIDVVTGKIEIRSP